MEAGMATDTAPKAADDKSGFIPPKPEELAQLFPQLEVLDFVGKGGMGAVYKARQPSLDRLVALKILPPEVGADPAFAERFTREARAQAKLSHPNIVSVYDFGQVDGQFFIIMEFVDGPNLRNVIKEGEVKPDQALAMVTQVCEALQFAHDEGMVHRDIKPENILVTQQGRVKVTDFGLVKFRDTKPEEPVLTKTLQAMGTLRYMAPEQMEGAAKVDNRADIYSVGVVFYELLTGELPIGKFAPPSKRVEVDVRLDEVVLRSLEKEPDQRYQQASEVRTDIQSISSAPKQAEAAPAEDNSTADITDRARANRRGVFWLLICFNIAVLLIGFTFRSGTMPYSYSYNNAFERLVKRSYYRHPHIMFMVPGSIILSIGIYAFVCSRNPVPKPKRKKRGRNDVFFP